MVQISIQKANEIRNFIAKNQIKQLIRILKKLKIFSNERGIFKVRKNYSQFLVAHKLKWSSTDYQNSNNQISSSIMNILNNIPY